MVSVDALVYVLPNTALKLLYQLVWAHQNTKTDQHTNIKTKGLIAIIYCAESP